MVGSSRHQHHRLLGVGRLRDTVGAPGVDLSVGEHNAGALDVGAAVDGVGEVDLFLHLVGGEAESLLAQVQVDIGSVQAL